MNLYRFLAIILEPGNKEVCMKFWRLQCNSHRHQMLLDLLADRFGTVPPLLEARIRAVTNPDTFLEAACQVRRPAFPIDLKL